MSKKKTRRVWPWVLGGLGVVVVGGYLWLRWRRGKVQAPAVGGTIPGVPGGLLPPVGGWVEDLLAELMKTEQPVTETPTTTPTHATLKPTVRAVTFPEVQRTYIPSAPMAEVKFQPRPVTGAAFQLKLPEELRTPGGYTQLVPVAGGEYALVAKVPGRTGGRYVIGEAWTEESVKALQEGAKKIATTPASPSQAAKMSIAMAEKAPAPSLPGGSHEHVYAEWR